MQTYFLLVLISLLACLTSHVLAAGDVALFVRNHTGVQQVNVPVRGGVPFARGVLQACSQTRLLDAAGKEIHCQVKPIAHWYDGSVKWLLVDTQVNLSASGEVKLQLQPGVAPKSHRTKVKVTQDIKGLMVDTGPARFLFSKTAFGLPTTVWADLNHDGKWDTQAASGGSAFVAEVEHQSTGEPEEENWLRDASGSPRERFTADASGDYKVEVENTNPLHVVVKLSGWLVNKSGRRLLQYVIRAHAYAGSPELRIVHNFVYAGKPKEDFLRAIWIRLPESTYNSFAFGGAQAHKGTMKTGDTLSLTEIGPKKIYHLAPYTDDKTVNYSLTKNGSEIAKGAEAEGWVRLAGSHSSMHLALRNFWQMHPKELRADSHGLSVYLWPESGNKVLDLRRRYDEVENKYHYDLSLWPYGGEGLGVTHEMTLRYGPAKEDLGPQMTAALNAPLLLQCSPEYYAASGAFGPFALVDTARYPHFEGLQNVDLEWIRHNQRVFHWDGMIDYGDNLFHGYETPSHYGYMAPKSWCSRGYVGWQCNDGTLTQSLFLQYLRSGDYEAYRTAEALCRHVTEIDACHYCIEEPKQVGGGHRHDQQHWGNGVRGYGTATHGAIDYYLMTGDERVLDVIKEYTQYHLDGEPSENEDRIGGLIRMWEINGDPVLKQKADELLTQELSGNSDTGWPFLTAAHFRFVSNTSVSLLYYLYSTSPEDSAKLKAAIVKAANSLEPEAMSSWGQVTYLPTIIAALAYQQTGETRYASLLASLLQRIPVPRDIALPSNFTDSLRALDFEGMVTAARQWNVNNIYTATIHDLVPLPYAIAALQKAGMDESAVWAVPRGNQLPPPFEEIIPLASMSPEIGHCFIAGINHGSPSDQGDGHSNLILMEDGKPLEPAHSAHADIRKEGNGRWSHWGARSLYFSTSDNTDPRTNGRQYKVVYKGAGK